MQFMMLFTRHPDRAETPTPADLREAEFEKVRGFYTDGPVQQIWLRSDAGGACMIVEATSIDEVAAKLNALPLLRAGLLQPPMIVAAEALFGVRSPLLTGKARRESGRDFVHRFLQ